jgi:CO/xanthine dehydrogenase Mo-binding subunit
VKVTTRFDSWTMSYTLSSGTYGSRFSSTGAVAAYGAARKLRQQLAALAARLLEADPHDVELHDGQCFVRGAPQRTISLRHLAATAHAAPDAFGRSSDPAVEATYRSSWGSSDWPDERGLYNAANTYAVMVHAAVVEVDPQTGAVKVLRYELVEDCGRIVNPAIVRGLTMGGLAHGLAWALTERFAYDDQGQLLTATFMDYLPVRFVDMPPLSVDHMPYPSPFSVLGAKGMAEGACIAPPACIANAVEDAIAHLGGRITDSHLSPELVLAAMRAPAAQP